MKIKNENQLLEILKIFAEESVAKAKKGLNESKDHAQNRYVKELEAAERKFGVSLTEEENAEEEVAEDETEKESDPVSDDKESKEGTVDAEVFGTSFDSVVKSINTLRAGRSTKDKEIKTELLDYYDRLTDDERKILHLFLKELSKILQGAIQGSEAIDPSDSPLFAKIVLQSKEEEDDQGDEEGTLPNKPSSEKSSEDEDEEDTSPPIKVGGQQNLQEIRKKVKRLMKRL